MDDAAFRALADAAFGPDTTILGATILNEAPADVPPGWTAYAASASADRQSAASAELSGLASVFPKTCGALQRQLRDARLVRVEDSPVGSGLFRAFAYESGWPDDDTAGLWLSRPPCGRDAHPLVTSGSGLLARFYAQRCDGFCDGYGFGGLIPLPLVRTIEHDDWNDAGWWAAVAERHDPAATYGIASNGGAAAILADARTGDGVWVDHEDGIVADPAPLRDLIDTFGSIAVTGA